MPPWRTIGGRDCPLRSGASTRQVGPMGERSFAAANSASRRAEPRGRRGRDGMSADGWNAMMRSNNACRLNASECALRTRTSRIRFLPPLSDTAGDGLVELDIRDAIGQRHDEVRVRIRLDAQHGQLKQCRPAGRGNGVVALRMPTQFGPHRLKPVSRHSATRRCCSSIRSPPLSPRPPAKATPLRALWQRLRRRRG
jgi:hypothetical protein